MTAVTTYSIHAEKESAAIINNLLQAANQDFMVLERPCPEESIHEKVDAVLMELYDLNLSLGTLGELLLDSNAKKLEPCGVGSIIEHYTGLVSDRVGEIQAVLTTDMRKSDD